MRGEGVRGQFEELLKKIVEACHDLYGDRLVSLAVFGSVGRGTFRPDSDVDLLIVADPLPKGRRRRVEEFQVIEETLEPVFGRLRSLGMHPVLSPIFKTKEEVRQGSLRFLDMSEDARILYDRDGFFATFLKGFRERLDRLGARRVWRGDVWYWELKPDYRPGEVFEL
ncbi:MAG: nucleotidyltransferase domain-containing protein [Candidatus Methylomirabilales bacterium]